MEHINNDLTLKFLCYIRIRLRCVRAIGSAFLECRRKCSHGKQQHNGRDMCRKVGMRMLSTKRTFSPGSCGGVNVNAPIGQLRPLKDCSMILALGPVSTWWRWRNGLVFWWRVEVKHYWVEFDFLCSVSACSCLDVPDFCQRRTSWLVGFCCVA